MSMIQKEFERRSYLLILVNRYRCIGRRFP